MFHNIILSQNNPDFQAVSQGRNKPAGLENSRSREPRYCEIIEYYKNSELVAALMPYDRKSRKARRV